MSHRFPNTDYQGLLFIGDPHLEGRVPGFRKDAYPQTILGKLRFCLDYAREESLLPAMLGDIFNLPRDNPNWLICALLELLDQEVLGVVGNHDIRENTLSPNDSLSIISRAGRIRLLTGEEDAYCGIIGGRPVVLGGTPWGQPLPESYVRGVGPDGQVPLVFWITHHDIKLPGYDGRFSPIEIPGIDACVNGHIHRRLGATDAGNTRWIIPGNIARVRRSEAARERIPAALRVDINASGWVFDWVEIPHQPFDDVFYESVTESPEDRPDSAFVAGLAELQHRRTDSGAGLMEFLERNLARYDHDIAREIRALAKDVLHHDRPQTAVR